MQKPSELHRLSKVLVALHRRRNQLLITHGNGPQVGDLAMHERKKLAELTEETEAQIGAEISRALVRAAGSKVRMAPEIVLTHVVVDKRDREFTDPTKPIGEFCGWSEAQRLRKKGFVMKHLLGGYRHVVPSPAPKKILETDRIERLLSSGVVVIAGGGGGIAMIKGRKGYAYADAVIDKDHTSALLAREVGADRLIILTNVDGIYLWFKTGKQRFLKKVHARELARYAKEGHFERGSMLPKVEACMEFVKGAGKIAVVGNLEKAESAFRLSGATVVS